MVSQFSRNGYLGQSSFHLSCLPATAMPYRRRVSMAFQPIILTAPRGAVFRLKAEPDSALVRGPAGEGAGTVIGGWLTKPTVTASIRLQGSRRFELSGTARPAPQGVEPLESISCPMPSTARKPVSAPRWRPRPASIIRSISLIFELTEGEAVADAEHLTRIVESYRKMGFKTAIDDFGAGYSGLNLLAPLPAGYRQARYGTRARHRSGSGEARHRLGKFMRILR